jgi:hypothetical protein
MSLEEKEVGRRLLGSLSCGWENNIKLDLK